jgi:hypothetical protein
MTCGLQLLEEVEAQLRAAANSVQTLFNNAVDRDVISNSSDGKHCHKQYHKCYAAVYCFL